MKKLILLSLLVVIAGFLFWSQNNANQNPVAQEGLSPTAIVENDTKDLVTVDKVDMQLRVPDGFQFSKEQQMNLTTNEAYAVTFTIQNYTTDPTQVSAPYQLYGIYQWDTAETTPEDFTKSDFMLERDTREEFSVDGHPAIKGVSSGERGRYTIYILRNGHLLTLAADGSDQRHRDITDSIVESIQFN